MSEQGATAMSELKPGEWNAAIEAAGRHAEAAARNCNARYNDATNQEQRDKLLYGLDIARTILMNIRGLERPASPASSDRDRGFAEGVEAAAAYIDEQYKMKMKTADMFKARDKMLQHYHARTEAQLMKVTADGVRQLAAWPGVVETFCGIEIRLDPNMPADVAEFRDHTGKVVGRIININAAASSARGDDKIELSEIDAEHILTGFYREPKE